MRLYEYEGKKLFKSVGIEVPIGWAISQPAALDRLDISFESTAVKMQVLQGKRGKGGGVKLCHGLNETKGVVAEFLGRDFMGEAVKKVLVEQYVGIEKEHYLALTYDPVLKRPVFLAGYKGGSGVEEISENLAKIAFNSALGYSGFLARELLFKVGFNNDEVKSVAPIVEKLWLCFEKYDCRLAEINPLVKTLDGRYLADDAKVVIDDNARFRQAIKPRVDLKYLTKREKAARAIDKGDYRGTAGASFLDLAGNVAILSSGGGGTLVAFDAFAKAALGTNFKAANLTEYSGNPSAEKVARLTEIVLSKPGLKGCWVVGGKANFTDIYETMRGFLAGLRKVKPQYPIVIRRGGPRTEEAFIMLKKAGEEEGFKFTLQTPETTFFESARALISVMTKPE